MVEIKPGPELDKAVAEAIGCAVQGDKGLYWCGCNRDNDTHGSQFHDGQPLLHHYSTDLNAAFAAAEKVRLFRDSYQLCQDTPLQWYIGDSRENSDGFCVQAPTPSLAICAAILKLKEKDDETT